MPALPDDSPAPDPQGYDRQVEDLYSALRELARRTIRGRSTARSLEPTELVHELYMKLARSYREGLSRSEFMALAASVLRSVLVDHARELATLKRGGNFRHCTLDGRTLLDRDELDILALHDALNQLALLDPRMAKVVELRFFAGLQVDDIAVTLGVSPRTVDKDWSMARAWLHRQMTP